MQFGRKHKPTGKRRHRRRPAARVHGILESVTRFFRSRTRLGIALVLCLFLIGIGLVVSRKTAPSRANLASVQQDPPDESDILFDFESNETLGDDAAIWNEFAEEKTSHSAPRAPSGDSAGPTLLPAESTQRTILPTGASEAFAPAFPTTRTAEEPPPFPNVARWPAQPTGAWLTGTIEEVTD